MEHHNSPDTIQQLINLIDSCPFTDAPALTVSQDRAKAFLTGQRAYIFSSVFLVDGVVDNLEMCGSANLFFFLLFFPFAVQEG